jgi:hypothetical protein
VTRILLFIKQRLPFLWQLVDWLNQELFVLIHRDKLALEATRSTQEFSLDGFGFRLLSRGDLDQLEDLLSRQGEERLEHFRPHGFGKEDLEHVYRNPSFLMFGVFDQDALVGYFFLRCFWNWRSFVGRLIDGPYERKGIGRVMNQILYNTAWRSGFRCHTTISKKNRSVMRSHANNPSVRILKELPNDYLLIEFLPPAGDRDGKRAS